jgi:cell wall-associated NlpC family hydrolase
VDPASIEAARRVGQAAARSAAADDGGGSRAKWLIAAPLALLVVILVTAFAAVTRVQQSQCATGAAAEGIADPISLSQLQVAARVVQVGEEMDRPERHEVAALATGLVESQLQNLPPEKSDNDANPNKVSAGHVSSEGVFQQQDFSPWTDHGRNRMNVRDAARTFYEQAQLKDRPGMTIGALAQEVQGSATPGAFEPRVPEARQILERVRDDDTLLAPVASAPSILGRVTAALAPATAAAATPATDANTTGDAVALEWPTDVHTIVSPFGARSAPCAGCSSFHEGLDIGAPQGAAVHAAAAGQIVVRGPVSGYGNYVCVRHRATFSTCYAHLSRFGAFQVGQLVDQGTIIGYVGATGNVTGPHLHFEVRRSPGAADPAVDPLPFLSGAATATGGTATAPTGGCDEDVSGLADGTAPIAPGALADLDGNVMSAPATAPNEVKLMIAASNAIQHLPYTFGGGHNAAYRPSPGFDCSSTVSYVLHKAGLLPGPPLDSSGLMRYGEPGPGKWVTIYAHPGHTFIYIAGQRLDTSWSGTSVTTERGPRWRGPGPRSTDGFTVVHPPGL